MKIILLVVMLDSGGELQPGVRKAFETFDACKQEMRMQLLIGPADPKGWLYAMCRKEVFA